MHELSIAVHIVGTISREFADRPGRILSVRLDVGRLSGVVPDALQFAWDVACQDTRLEGSTLQIRDLPVVVRCDNCQREHTLPSIDRLRCPVCDSWTPEIISGQELQIRAVQIARPAAAPA